MLLSNFGVKRHDPKKFYSFPPNGSAARYIYWREVTLPGINTGWSKEKPRLNGGGRALPGYCFLDVF